MTVSRDEAVALLRKWATESTPVSAMLVADSASVSFSGFIREVMPTALVVAHSSGAGKVVELIVGLLAIETFTYQDVREAPEDVRERIGKTVAACLVMESADMRCCLFELG